VYKSPRVPTSHLPSPSTSSLPEALPARPATAKMIRPGQTPLQITILLLVLYILHLHWTQPDSIYHASLQPITVIPASVPVPVSPAAHTPAIPIAAPVPKKNVITLSTDKANWSKSKGGVANGIFQRPHSPQRKGMRIAIATMNTDETSYDHISLRNKFGE
jgi:hypothetical protein